MFSTVTQEKQQFTIEQLQGMARVLERELEVGEHKYHFKKYPNCFVAADAVSRIGNHWDTSWHFDANSRFLVPWDAVFVARDDHDGVSRTSAFRSRLAVVGLWSRNGDCDFGDVWVV